MPRCSPTSSSGICTDRSSSFGSRLLAAVSLVSLGSSYSLEKEAFLARFLSFFPVFAGIAGDEVWVSGMDIAASVSDTMVPDRAARGPFLDDAGFMMNTAANEALGFGASAANQRPSPLLKSAGHTSHRPRHKHPRHHIPDTSRWPTLYLVRPDRGLWSAAWQWRAVTAPRRFVQLLRLHNTRASRNCGNE